LVKIFGSGNCDRGLSPSLKRIRGQALVELALLIIPLVLLIVGALEMGRGFLLQVAVTGAAREGAYYLANTTDPNFSNVTAVVENELQHTGVTDVKIYVDDFPPTIDQPVTVTVKACGQDFLIINTFFGVDTCLSSSAEMMVVR
jgi:Flp pilus assembly protein TadG